MPDKLIIFDYSGTLSPEAAAFSRPDKLVGHLQKSGLSALGVDSTDLFWKIVNETWEEGSTTRRGYKTVLQERIAELFPEKAFAKRREISRAAANFVDAYFDHSRIDGHWRSILKKLSYDKSVKAIIATDHYAEATAAIIAHLGKFDIAAMPLAADGRSNFVVANSADIGAHKDESKFWETIRTNCGSAARHILLIDDFGMNEQSSDAYAQEKEIIQRRQEIIFLLENIFLAEVECFMFAAKNTPITDLVLPASEKISEYLSNKRG